MMRAATIHEKVDGPLLVRHDGSIRYLTMAETLLYRIFGKLPKA